MEKLQLKIITPDFIFFDRDVRFVVLQGLDGDFGILPNHDSSIVVLNFGEVRIFEEDEKSQTEAISVLGGFASIDSEGVTVVSEFVAHPDKIDKERMRRIEKRRASRQEDKQHDANVQRAEMALRRSLVGGSTQTMEAYTEDE